MGAADNGRVSQRLRRLLLTPVSFSRHWPGFLFALLAVVGGLAGGPGAALGAPVLGMLVIGPAYLIQQRVRRRRIAPPPGGFLGQDASERVDEFGKAYAGFWLGLMRSHPVAMPIIDLALYVALVSLAWIFVGPTAGVAALAITLALYGLGIARVLRRRGSRP